MTEEIKEQIGQVNQILLAGWRKWGMCMAIEAVATALLFCNQPGPEGTWVPILTGEQWIWLSIRVLFIYIVGNVGASAFDKFFTK